MHDEFAPLWPLFSDPADYAAEAALWRQALRAALGPGRHHLLELGVGGGSNLSHLTAKLEATAADRSERMLASSRRLELIHVESNCDPDSDDTAVECLTL